MLKNPVRKYYQLSYAQKQKDKNLHAYYDQHRAVRQNISLPYQELKKAMLLQEDQSFADADHGILQPARMWKVGRSQNADLFRLEQRRNSLDFVVDILVDASGSQRPRQENVTLQTYILKPPAHPVPRDELLYVLGLHDPAPDARLRRSAGEEQQYF